MRYHIKERGYFIVFLLLIFVFTGCSMTMKTFSIKGYEDIDTYNGPPERNQWVISDSNILIKYSTLYLDPQAKSTTFAVISIQNLSDKKIQVVDFEWNHFYKGQAIDNIYDGSALLEKSFLLYEGSKKIFQFETNKKENEFSIGDILTVEISVKYRVGDNEFKTEDVIELICHSKKRPVNIP